VSSTRKARVLAFHLPQFHPIPENDEWWGTGFTEWTNTARARRLFPGHYQPHVPADLGFYDLRTPEARSAQAEMASRFGVDGFVYWHYWFGGRRILERPVDEVLSSRQPDFPYCLGWANQTWTGTWHGAPDRILIEQTYPGPEDDEAHFCHLLAHFRDERYVKVDGKPVFYVFRPEQLPDALAWTKRWRALAERSGLPGLFLIGEYSDLHGVGASYPPPTQMGFDAAVHVRLPFRRTPAATTAMRLARKFGLPEIYRYTSRPVDRPVASDELMYPAIYPNWDNTPRAGRRGLALVGSTPERFRAHVRDAIERVASLPDDRRFVFVKSWNEWAEGNHLEPDLKFGTSYLEVLRSELATASPPGERKNVSRFAAHGDGS
jgi:lipopolysaccharide biosynthesis protein